MDKIYFDEAGYTGSDLTNESQPYFALASVRFSEEELDRIRKDVGLDTDTKEIHFKKMHTNWEGRSLLLKLFSHPLLDRSHIKTGIALKRFCIYAQMIDTIIETYCYEKGIDLYKNQNNNKLANLLYAFSIFHKNQRLVSHFEKAFVEMIRKHSQEAVEEFYHTADLLINDSATMESYKELLSMFPFTIETVQDALVSDNPFYLDNTLSLFVALVEKWYSGIKSKDEIVFDNSKPIAFQKTLIEKLRDMPVAETKVGYDNRKHVFPLPIGNIQLASSTDYLGIQIADTIASAIVFILTNKNAKLQKFQQQLQGIEVFKETDVPLTPSTAEQLVKSIDTSSDVNPLDFICEHL
mgnify:CR=1 FL=1